MGGSSAGAGSSTGGSGGPPKQNVVQRVVSSTVNYVKGGGMIGAGIRAVGRAKEQNRRNQLTSQFASEEGPIGSRNNNNMGGGDSGNDTAPTQVATNVGGTIVTAPSSAEVSQSNAADVTYDSRKTKAKGRSMTILTSSRGVRNNTNAVLGTKSLLGRA
jgi:hypothetical protein